MISIEIRLEPLQGDQDLAWTRRTLDDIHDIYQFLLEAQAAYEVEARETRTMSEADHERAVQGVAAETGTPLVEISQGSLLLELAQFLDQTTGVQALLALGLLFKNGPEAAAWPGRLRESWYSSREQALRARQSYERLRSDAKVELVERRQQVDDPSAVQTTSQPRARQTIKRTRPPVNR